MKLFHCDGCGNALFFENVKCLHCGSELVFLPTRMALAAIEPVPEAQGLWRRKKPGATPSSRHYRLCQNNIQQQACNFAVPASDPNPLCVSCRLTQLLPDLSVGAESWAHYLHMVDLLETAASYNTRLAVPGGDDDVDAAVVNPFGAGQRNFEQLVEQWVPLTLLVNSLKPQPRPGRRLSVRAQRGVAEQAAFCSRRDPVAPGPSLKMASLSRHGCSTGCRPRSRPAHCVRFPRHVRAPRRMAPVRAA